MSSSVESDSIDSGDIEGVAGKQRRNLMFSSALLIIYYVAGARISNLTLPGVTIHVERPGAIVVCVWIVFFYFLWRYWLYSKDAYFNFRERIDKGKYKYADEQLLIDFIVDQRGGAIRERMASYGAEDWEIVKIDWLGDSRYKVPLEVQLCFLKDGRRMAPYESFRVDIPHQFMLLAKLHSFLEDATSEKYFSDRLLPYLLALVAILSGTYVELVAPLCHAIVQIRY